MPSTPSSQNELATASPIIEVTNLAKEYRLGENVLLALQDVHLSLRAGEFVTMVGPSGCGKSTLLNIVGGLVEKTRGTVRIHDRDVVGPRRDVGMMFQSPVLLPWRTNLENILLPAEVFGLRNTDYENKARDLLRMVDLEEFTERYPF